MLEEILNLILNVQFTAIMTEWRVMLLIYYYLESFRIIAVSYIGTSPLFQLVASGV
jgi:hypothetical protein